MRWTPELDAKIISGKARMLSCAQIAKKLGAGFTRNMVIARHARIRGVRYPSEEAAAKARRLKSAARHWGDISTAPNDRDILAAAEVSPGKWVYAQIRVVEGVFWDWGWGHLPTDWCELPAPPVRS